MYKNKGITLIALVVTIAIMIILATFTIAIIGDIIDKSNLEDIKTSMLAIQAKARTVKEMNDYDNNVELIGDSIALSFLPTGETHNYRKLSKPNLEDIGLGNIPTDAEEFYIVDYGSENCEIYYSLGVKVENGNIIYSLTELKEH